MTEDTNAALHAGVHFTLLIIMLVDIRFVLVDVQLVLIDIQLVLFFLFFFQVQPYNRKYRSIGHRVWSMSLNFLTEL